MSLERRVLENDTVKDKYNLFTATPAAALTIRDQVNLVSTSDATAVVLTLPPVAEARGLFFSFYMKLSNTGDCTIQDQNESLGWTDKVMTATDDNVLLYSDGLRWWVLVDVTT